MSDAIAVWGILIPICELKNKYAVFYFFCLGLVRVTMITVFITVNLICFPFLLFLLTFYECNFQQGYERCLASPLQSIK